ncbi:hypothetical protein CLV44_102137 [Marinobacterium halophilum]|uniref:Uncharacterized protein n=1 Tax=Marinobacterium halophilum TaxID=267374 RepID=A0A2P8F3B3_9GAMM|nr:hypothetical protein CLV44_102137 [Marinobacterium halophilum]
MKHHLNISPIQNRKCLIDNLAYTFVFLILVLHTTVDTDNQKKTHNQPIVFLNHDLEKLPNMTVFYHIFDTPTF